MNTTRIEGGHPPAIERMSPADRALLVQCLARALVNQLRREWAEAEALAAAREGAAAEAER
jgi:hypothetical protein